MKLRSPTLTRVIGVAGAELLRRWLRTVRFRVQWHSRELDPDSPAHRGGLIYAFWHEAILGVVGVRRPRPSAVVLISRHQDGEYIAQIAQRLGACVVRGSSTRGGAAGLLALLRGQPEHDLLITPDGPRGPRRRVQPGVVYLASRSGRPIVPVGFGFERAWRAASWDRFALPRPYSLVTCVVGRPLRVPQPLSAADLEHWRTAAEEAMMAATARAQRWAQSG